MTPTVDVHEQGAGPTVVLVHSSVAGAGQWRSLMDGLSDRYRLLAPNLFGYGATPSWSGPQEQTLLDQAQLVAAALPDRTGRFSLVGHSFGGSVAMKAAELFRDRVDRLVLIEPNPFHLLLSNGRLDAFAEARALRDCIKENGGRGDWAAAAEVFADYWTGNGSWAAMPEGRREKFAEALRPNFHEWDAVMNETKPLHEWREHLPDKTTVICAKDTVRSIREIVYLMHAECPAWRFRWLGTGGHMAALTRPEEMKPLVAEALA